jgi:hypothetical protein
MAGSSDVKGKKRARDEDELVVEYDEAIRFCRLLFLLVAQRRSRR